MVMRLVVNANFRPGFSVFLMLRKEARAAYARYLGAKASVRRIERRLGKLDAVGAGRGLPRREVFKYNSYVREARLYTEQMEALSEILARYGQRLDAEMMNLAAHTSTAIKLALIGAPAGLSQRYEGAQPSFHDLVVRDRVEVSSGGYEIPVLSCLLAYRGELLEPKRMPRQATQMHHFVQPEGTPARLRAVSS